MYGDFTHLFLYLHIYSSVGLCWTMMIGLRLISQLEREGKKVDGVILLLYNVLPEPSLLPAEHTHLSLPFFTEVVQTSNHLCSLLIFT